MLKNFEKKEPVENELIIYLKRNKKMILDFVYKY